MELPRTNAENASVRVRTSFGKRSEEQPEDEHYVYLSVNNLGGVSLDAREIDDLCVMLQYAKKVVIEEGGVID